jgi:hypothetical protein
MTGHGFPTAAYRDRISRFWGAFDVDAGSSPLPPFGDADGRSDAERYETADELVGQIMTGIDVEHRTVTDEDENLGDVEHALDAIGPRTIMENLRRGGSENPLGDLSLIIEDAMKRMGGFEPSDPNLAPMPDLAALMAPPGSQPDEATMYKAESMLAHTAPLAPEIAREAREAPLHELGQAAELAYELVLSLDLVAGDDEKARAAGAVLAPGFVAILEVLGPMAVNLLARRGLDTAFEPEATKDPTT